MMFTFDRVSLESAESTAPDAPYAGLRLRSATANDVKQWWEYLLWLL